MVISDASVDEDSVPVACVPDVDPVTDSPVVHDVDSELAGGHNVVSEPVSVAGPVILVPDGEPVLVWPLGIGGVRMGLDPAVDMPCGVGLPLLAVPVDKPP
jgi:hypothetical protein